MADVTDIRQYPHRPLGCPVISRRTGHTNQKIVLVLNQEYQNLLRELLLMGRETVLRV